eukprot:Rhum_TRINITY_DN11608_c0_g2::Rhum_TRINITY_DN11608_c0_g2_i1::g.45726::m.45726
MIVSSIVVMSASTVTFGTTASNRLSSVNVSTGDGSCPTTDTPTVTCSSASSTPASVPTWISPRLLLNSASVVTVGNTTGTTTPVTSTLPATATVPPTSAQVTVVATAPAAEKVASTPDTRSAKPLVPTSISIVAATPTVPERATLGSVKTRPPSLALVAAGRKSRLSVKEKESDVAATSVRKRSFVSTSISHVRLRPAGIVMSLIALSVTPSKRSENDCVIVPTSSMGVVRKVSLREPPRRARSAVFRRDLIVPMEALNSVMAFCTSACRPAATASQGDLMAVAGPKRAAATAKATTFLHIATYVRAGAVLVSCCFANFFFSFFSFSNEVQIL